ncbi:MAG TPA: RsmE family RNA methyltransferase [Acidimicrobiales bacterium]|nr:RsmE family RNA methyltransferase [Acidimicrobiales bacterium]
MAGLTPVTARAHVFVGDVDAPALDPADHHHLTRALRLRPGSEVTAGDGAGRWRVCRLSDTPALAPAGPVVSDARPAPPITVAFALVKGERPELTVQKLTELGVDHMVPFEAERSVVKWEPGKAARQVQRWRTIAHEAAMQCRRTWLPEVSPVATFAAAAALPDATLADVEGKGPTLERPVVLVGPEGGWSPSERACGLPLVRLGAHVLRAETAAIAAGALLAALRAQAVAPSGGAGRAPP